MRLLEVGIKNFKSLRDVTFKPGGLTVLIGPNGAGKSNLCEALDFLHDMYRWGLELAVARHGGYENICYRHTRRSTSPIALRVVTSMSGERWWPRSRRDSKAVRPHEIIVDRQIAFRASSRSLRAPFSITEEAFSYTALFSDGSPREVIFAARRRGETVVKLHVDKEWREDRGRETKFLDEELRETVTRRLDPTESFERSLPPYLIDLPWRWEGRPSVDLYQIQPGSSRSAGIPTPNPELGRDGANLPGAIDMLKSRDPKAFQAILDTLKTIMPGLRDIDVVNTPQRTLGLAFQEEGFGQPWPVEHVSDGTIRALGLLVALFSSHSDLIAIEEPENSLHPWAIGQFIDACRLASKTKQIVLTTHSPVVVDQLKPEEVWVVAKPGAETKIDRLVDLDPVAQTGWEDGDFTVSEFLDSGIVPGTVPAL